MNNFYKGDSVNFNWYIPEGKEMVKGFIINKKKTKNPGYRCVLKNNKVSQLIYDNLENINKTTVLYTIFSLNDDVYENIQEELMSHAEILLIEII